MMIPLKGEGILINMKLPKERLAFYRKQNNFFYRKGNLPLSLMMPSKRQKDGRPTGLQLVTPFSREIVVNL